MPYLLLLGIPTGLAALGFAVDKTGEGINDASNGAVKLLFAAGITYYALKKTKVLG